MTTRATTSGVVTVQYALEHSSDVGAAKMALKLGPNKFYDYMRGFGFGDRSGIELPSETRGLLRAPKKWGVDEHPVDGDWAGGRRDAGAAGDDGERDCEWRGVHAAACAAAVDGRDEGRSAAEAGGVSTGEPAAGDAAGWGASGDQGADLGEDADDDAGHRGGRHGQDGGAERVQLGRKDGNGAEDRSGDAHVLAHEAGGELCGICAGEQPGDLDRGGDRHADGADAQRYGGAASAPVFAEVAQQVLEYLGVPHDQPLKTKKELLANASKEEVDDHPQDDGIVDLNAMFADVNDLPADDPLRNPQQLALPAETGAASAKAPVDTAKNSAGVMRLLPAKVLEAFRANGGTTSTMPDASAGATAKLEPPKVQPEVQAKNGGVVVDASQRIAVPTFEGEGLRAVVEKAGGVGLRVQPVGSGIAREQAPAAGTMVPVGTEVVVRFLR